MLPAVTIFGLGLAITVAPLTAAALAAVPARHAGMASAVHNDVARTAALIAVAVLPAAAGLTGTAKAMCPRYEGKPRMCRPTGLRSSVTGIRRRARSGSTGRCVSSCAG